MSERIHDDEPDTSESVVRALLEAECPAWAGLPLTYLATSGTDNAMWRITTDSGPDLVIRLPRRPGAAAGARSETSLLRQLQDQELGPNVATPRVRHQGSPHETFPHPWSVLEWIDGIDAWTARAQLDGRSRALATDLGHAVLALRSCRPNDLRHRAPGDRGGPLGPLLDRLDGWLTDPAWNAASLVDLPAIQRIAAEARELTHDPVTRGFVHGDLIPGNLIVADGRLGAIIDWGGAGWGDLAQDLAPAWAVLDTNDRAAFREVVEADVATWLRGRAIELEHAVGGVLYYVPRKHPLGDVMARTLSRILADAE